MTAEIPELPLAPQPPFFTLDLGINGGTFAPRSGTELSQWVNEQRQFWAWLPSVQVNGNHKSAVDQSFSSLLDASNQMPNIVQLEVQSNPNVLPQVQLIHNLLRQAFIDRKLPHSTSALGQRVEQIRSRDPVEAVAYLFVYLPPSGYQFDARDNSSWRGFIEAHTERSDVASVPHAQFEAAIVSLQATQRLSDQRLEENTTILGQLQRHYEVVSSEISETASAQKEAFKTFIAVNQQAHDDAMSGHGSAMETLEKTFREKMALRAPVEYWENRQRKHESRAFWTGCFSFGSMAALVAGLGAIAW